jgi:hypothetical protein
MDANYIIGLGSEHDPNALPLYTKKRNRITNSQRKQQVPAIMEAMRAAVQAISPDIKLRSLSSQYDCVGMIFASRRTAIGAEHLEMILSDDGYYRVSPRDAVCGDLIVYRDKEGTPNHLALISAIIQEIAEGNIRFECLSQWGENGEYFHREDKISKWFGPNREIWSERLR